MNEKKSKAYKASILSSIICVILTGVNYVNFKIPMIGVAFIISLIGCIVIIVCYEIEKRKEAN
ncbi:hypothetical protein [Acetivibrio clariflavus]|uniref:hypothetical protein n=1 Tax=Acetivibrio clariflavus TaxID=288965 RepID=UPI0004895011|nr:hypothetical protein [Acetivibrio clariflavus]